MKGDTTKLCHSNPVSQPTGAAGYDLRSETFDAPLCAAKPKAALMVPPDYDQVGSDFAVSWADPGPRTVVPLFDVRSDGSFRDSRPRMRAGRGGGRVRRPSVERKHEGRSVDRSASYLAHRPAAVDKVGSLQNHARTARRDWPIPGGRLGLGRGRRDGHSDRVLRDSGEDAVELGDHMPTDRFGFSPKARELLDSQGIFVRRRTGVEGIVAASDSDCVSRSLGDSLRTSHSVKVGIGTEAAQQQSVDAVVRRNPDTRRHGRMSRVDV